MKNQMGNLLGATLVLSLCSATFPWAFRSHAVTVEIPIYTLGSGDRVKDSVFGESDRSGEF